MVMVVQRLAEEVVRRAARRRRRAVVVSALAAGVAMAEAPCDRAHRRNGNAGAAQ